MKSDSKRKTTPVLIVLFIILAATLAVQSSIFKSKEINESQDKSTRFTPQNSIDTDQNQKENIVFIDFGNGQKIEKTVNAKTPYQALEMAAAGEGFQITAKQYKYGLMVEGINRINNTPEKYWLYSVNGEAGRVAADYYLLDPGDVVEWKYGNTQ